MVHQHAKSEKAAKAVQRRVVISLRGSSIKGPYPCQNERDRIEQRHQDKKGGDRVRAHVLLSEESEPHKTEITQSTKAPLRGGRRVKYFVAGVYLFVHYNTNHPLPRDIAIEGFKNAAFIDLQGDNVPKVDRFLLEPDRAPAADVQSRLFESIRLSKPPERQPGQTSQSQKQRRSKP